MKISIQLNLNPINVIRRAGYGQVRDSRASEPSWSRRLGSGVYPRFHAYINGREINLHLDQKQASYSGYSAHSGEYDSETVIREGQKISGVMAEIMAEQTNTTNTAKPAATEQKKGLFGRIFGV